MTLIQQSSRNVVAMLAIILTFSAVSIAQTNETNFPHIKIKNFGQMNERFYRGGRPTDQDYQALAAIGVNTVIDLTDNSREFEQPAVEAAGLRYVNIPMIDKSYPSMEQVNEFLRVANDPATGKFYLHCAGGRHRTGVMGAVYRFTHDGWNLEQVLAEMNRYGFNSGWGHGKQKDFVHDYWQQFHAKHVSGSNSAAVAH